MMIVLTITLRHQLIFNVSGIRIQIPYRQQETLLVELTGTHEFTNYLSKKKKMQDIYIHAQRRA